jgi:hypothetical protein
VTVFTGGAVGTRIDLPVATGGFYSGDAPNADRAIADR